jgi:hypothetical protein
MANDWQDLTFQVLGTMRSAQSRLGPYRLAPWSDLESQIDALNEILVGYKAGRWRTEVEGTEWDTFQNLKTRLVEQDVKLGAEEPTLAVDGLTNYLTDFFSVGPHGPGGGPPKISSEDERDRLGPGPTGTGGGPPGFRKPK